jgi:rhodanese-related sulfurtransferase
MMKKSTLVFVAALILSVFIFAETSNVEVFAGKRPVLKSIGVDEAVELIEKNKDNGDFIILDIRTPEEYEYGHLENAINIDFYSDSFQQDLARLEKNKIYLEYCMSGIRSTRWHHQLDREWVSYRKINAALFHICDNNTI